MSKKTFGLILRIVIVLASALLIGVAIYYLFKLLYPFIIAALLVVVINPVISFLQNKWRFPRMLAVVTTLLLLFVIFAGAMTLLIAEIISGTVYLARVVPDKINAITNSVQAFFIDKVVPYYEGIAVKFYALDDGKQETITSSIQEASNNLSGSVTSFLQNFLTALPSLISWIPGAATAIIFILLATYFISKEWDKLMSMLSRHLPTSITTPSGDVFNDIKKAGIGFIRAQFILITVTFIIVIIGLLILRIDHALTVAVIIALVDLIPILGISAVFIPWIIYTFFTGNIFLGIGLSIILTVATIVRRFIEPKVLATSLNLDPLATLISLFVGFKLFGFLGLIIGPVLLVIGVALNRTGTFHAIYRYIVHPRKKSIIKNDSKG